MMIAAPRARSREASPSSPTRWLTASPTKSDMARAYPQGLFATGTVAIVTGYSGTPLPKKLGIKPDSEVVVLGPAPDGFLPDVPRAGGREPADVIVSFHVERADLEERLPALRALMRPAAGLWIAWPKRASGVATDLTEDVVRELGLANRLVDNKVCAIDGTWSGLRLVIRLVDR